MLTVATPALRLVLARLLLAALRDVDVEQRLLVLRPGRAPQPAPVRRDAGRLTRGLRRLRSGPVRRRGEVLLEGELLSLADEPGALELLEGADAALDLRTLVPDLRAPVLDFRAHDASDH
eukprot:3832103-Rhodomonas_salina.1